METHPLLKLTVADPERRGAAVTLLKVVDEDVTDTDIHARIIARSKQLLGMRASPIRMASTSPASTAARYVNAFPGTPGDYPRLGRRHPRARRRRRTAGEPAIRLSAPPKIVVLEEELAKKGVTVRSPCQSGQAVRKDDPDRAYTC